MRGFVVTFTYEDGSEEKIKVDSQMGLLDALFRFISVRWHATKRWKSVSIHYREDL